MVSIFACIALLVNSSFVDLRNDHFRFHGYFGNQPLEEGKNYFCASKNDSISVSMCRFYVSDVQLFSGSFFLGTYDFTLVDLLTKGAGDFDFPFYSEGDVTEIRFNLGIDSTTNANGVGGGVLDPTKGMYWSWQSGYVNMKLEGKCNQCTKGRGEFQYHLGGYAAPYNALRQVVLKVNKDNGDFDINVDVEQFFTRTDMKGVDHVMSPSAKAVELAGNAATMFSVSE